MSVCECVIGHGGDWPLAQTTRLKSDILLPHSVSFPRSLFFFFSLTLCLCFQCFLFFFNTHIHTHTQTHTNAHTHTHTHTFTSIYTPESVASFKMCCIELVTTEFLGITLIHKHLF